MKLSELDNPQFVAKPKSGLSAGVGTFAKGVPVGIAKTFGEAALGAGQIGRSIQGALPSWMSSVPGGNNESMFDKNNADRIRQTTLKANAPGEGAGKFIGTAAQFMLPTSSITKGQQILGSAAKSVPTLLGRTTAKGAARFLPEAVGTGAVSALRSGGDLEQAKQEGTIAGGFSVSLGALGGLARSTYWPLLDDSVNKALGIQGKKTGGVALKETAQKTTGLQVLKNRAKDLTVTLDDGTKAVFNPEKATYNTTLQAWNQARKNIYSQYSSLTKTAGKTATADLSTIRTNLAKTLEEPRLSVYKNAAKTLINDLDNNFDDLTKVDLVKAEKFLEDLNSQTVNGFFKGTSDAASSEINAGTARILREQLDDVITKTTGSEYQALRSEYSALKSIEDDLVRKFQQNARSIGGGLSEYMGMFSSGDIVGGLLTAQPGQVAKGGIIGALATLKRTLADPERFLKRSFQLIDNEVPSDLTLRIWGGSRPLSGGEESTAKAVAKSIKEPALGMSIRSSVTPEKVGKSIDKTDFRKITDIIDNVDRRVLHERLLKDMGLSKAADSELVRFLKEVVDIAEGRGF